MPSILLLLAVASFVLWQRGPLKDFGLNAFTEILGIIITVVIVERLLARQEARRNMPLKAAAYEDVRLLVSRLVSLLRTMFIEAVPQPAPTTVDALLTKESVDSIVSNLNVDAEAPVFPDKKWFEYLRDVGDEQRQAAEKILERYAATLDPKAYQLVHKLLDGTLDIGLMTPSTVRHLDRVKGWPRPTVLGFYTVIDSIDPEPIRLLYEWTVETEMLLRRRGVSDLRPAAIEFRAEQPKSPPPAAFRPGELEAQLEAWEKFEKESQSKS